MPPGGAGDLDFLGKNPGDPGSWYEGITSIFVLLYHHPALWAARRSRRVHKAYAQLWGTPTSGPPSTRPA